MALAHILRTQFLEHVKVSLLLGKSRVTPIKRQTIPRLELQAAVVAVRIARTLKAELGVEVDSTYFWTDSMIVLGYIRKYFKAFQDVCGKSFVGNSRCYGSESVAACAIGSKSS